jgi:uncharacterized membrane protein
VNENLRILISAVVALLATVCAAVALRHIGRDLRQFKDRHRRLQWRRLDSAGVIGLVVVGAIVGLVASGAYYRVYVEGVYSGEPQLAVLLAALVATVLAVSAWLVFLTAFKNGSPEHDDMLAFYRELRPHLRRQRRHLRRVAECDRQLEALRAAGPLRSSRLEVLPPDPARRRVLRAVEEPRDATGAEAQDDWRPASSHGIEGPMIGRAAREPGDSPPTDREASDG